VQKIVADFDRKKRADASIAIASLSAGLVMCSAQEPFSKVYNKADKALYHVKQNGKNGYSFYSEESETDDYDEDYL
jgi:GGDEF domain-containing protein